MSAQIIIAVGTSAGGLAALRILVAGLPENLPAPVCIVQHIGRHRSELPALLSAEGPLPAVHPEDGAPLVNGRIYVAPPDYHLLISDSHLHLTRGPRENFARPAIDPLFRSAAEAYGPNAIGVILTGNLNDGTAGLYEIKRRGGIAVVQSLHDAEYKDMPRSALAHVAVDHCIAVADIPPLLARLAAVGAGSTRPTQEAVQMTAAQPMTRPVALTCPECGGAVKRNEIGTLTQYRCHIGHTLTAEAMTAAQFSGMEKAIEAALRLINERIEICRQMAERSSDAADPGRKEAWYAAMHEAKERAAVMSKILSGDWQSPEL